jgi:hypothetical protein
MDVRPSRLRHGEWTAGVSAVVLLVSMLALDWYQLNAAPARVAASLGRPTSFTGWTALTHLRWLLVVTIVATLALVFVQATRRSPAIPVTISVLVTVLGLINAVAVLYRVVINVPGDQLHQAVGAWLGLAAALGILYGGYASMREEGIATRDGPQEIELVRLPGQPSGS